MKQKKSTKGKEPAAPSTTSSKTFDVYTTTQFEEDARYLKRRYPLISQDIIALNQQLKQDPITGNDSLGKSCYKVRMKISGKNCGKSYGARIIINVHIIEGEVYLLSIYDKSDKKDIDEQELDEMLKSRLS